MEYVLALSRLEAKYNINFPKSPESLMVLLLAPPGLGDSDLIIVCMELACVPYAL